MWTAWYLAWADGASTSDSKVVEPGDKALSPNTLLEKVKAASAFVLVSSRRPSALLNQKSPPSPLSVLSRSSCPWVAEDLVTKGARSCADISRETSRGVLG